MKKWAVLLLALGLLAGCSGESSQDKVKEEKPKVEETETEASSDEAVEETSTDVETTEETEVEAPSIDTSVFVYAENVEVTDARDMTKHIDLVVHMSEETKTGMAAQHVFGQTYDFLQQSDIAGAETVTIGVMQADTRIAQITVTLSKFAPSPDKSMVKCVLEASTIDKMSDEVKEHGKIMELW